MSDFQGLPKTTNLNLNKPGYDNVADIMALNENADIIDAAIKTNIDDIANIKKGYVKTVNGVGVDSKGNVNVKEYTHPASGVTAGSYRKVTVDTLGHVTAGENPILAIAEGGTGADNATSALSNLGILGAIINASVSGKTITFTKKDNTKFSIDTQDTNNGIVAALLKQNGYVKFANGLILQWGKHARTTDYEQITFPISFTNVNYTCISTSYDLNSNADVTSAYSGTYNSGKYPEEQERTVSRFYVKTGSNAGGRDWIAIGQQQWGIKAASTYTWTYPLPLAVVYYADMMGYRKGSAGSEYGWIRSISPIAFETYIIDESAICFCVGIAQQWGVSVTSNTGPVTITYPIAHTIFACPYTTSAMSFEAVAAINTNNNTVQSFDVHARWSSSSNAAAWAADTFNWFSVGI